MGRVIFRRSQRRVRCWAGEVGVKRVGRGGRVRERKWAFMKDSVVMMS